MRRGYSNGVLVAEERVLHLEVGEQERDELARDHLVGVERYEANDEHVVVQQVRVQHLVDNVARGARAKAAERAHVELLGAEACGAGGSSSSRRRSGGGGGGGGERVRARLVGEQVLEDKVEASPVGDVVDEPLDEVDYVEHVEQ